MKLSDQAMGAIMMALQKSLLDQSDIVPVLKEMNFDFDFQEKIILVDKFRYQDKAIRAITLTVDFVIRHNGMNIYLDTKGFATEVAKIKYKMLKNKLKDDSSTSSVMTAHTWFPNSSANFRPAAISSPAVECR